MNFLKQRISLAPEQCFFAFYVASFLHLYDRLISYNYKDYTGMTLSDSYLYYWIPDNFPLNETMTWLNPTLIGVLVLLLPFLKFQYVRIIWFFLTFMVEGFRFFYSQGHDGHLFVWLTLILAIHPGNLSSVKSPANASPLFLQACQIQVLLIYALSGIWKIIGYVESLWNSNVAGGFEYLPYSVATEFLNSGTVNHSTLWLSTHPTASFVLTLLMLVAQIGSVILIFYPGFYFLGGILLTLFHVGAMLAVGVVFTWSVLPILIFLCLAEPRKDSDFLTKLFQILNLRKHLRNA